MRNPNFLYLCLLTFFFSIHDLVEAALLVKYLPGFEGRPLPFELETGYVSVEDVELFYYFLKSERNAEHDPLMIWLTGGPGCSAICGLLMANGPLAFKGDEYNGTVPPLELTSYSWTKVANILYIESPAGSGYSYARNQRASEASDTKQFYQINQFLRTWFMDHLEFISNPFYVGGGSYSGRIVPGVVQQISLGNEKGLTPLINLQGYVLGNPTTDDDFESNFRISFAHGMGLISDELFQSLERSCGGKFLNVDPSNARCLNNLQTYNDCLSEIYLEHILLPNCELDNVIIDKPQSLPNIRTERSRELKEFSGHDSSSSLPPPSCCVKILFYLIHHFSIFIGLKSCDIITFILSSHTYKYFLSGFWANDENVRRALGVKKEFGKWNRCNTQNIPYTYDIVTAFPYLVNNSLRGLRSLIYSGDHDYKAPFSSTQAWIKALNYSIVNDWRPWMMSSNQVAGYTRTYANKMTFATIKGGGHTAEYNPDQCSVMFRRWIDGEPL